MLLQVHRNNYKADLQFFHCIWQLNVNRTVESGTQLKTVHICSVIISLLLKQCDWFTLLQRTVPEGATLCNEIAVYATTQTGKLCENLLDESSDHYKVA